MFIQTESTPNPLTLKFVPGEIVHPTGTAFYTSKEDASASPLAQRLFDVGEVTAVFLSNEFITVTKSPESDWEDLKPALLTSIMDHYVAGLPVVNLPAAGAPTPTPRGATAAMSEEDAALVEQIVELIDTRVRPAVAQDGGDIIFHSFKDGIVHLEMHGACSGCPSSTATLKGGIENMLKHYVPEVIAVEAVGQL